MFKNISLKIRSLYKYYFEYKFLLEKYDHRPNNLIQHPTYDALQRSQSRKYVHQSSSIDIRNLPRTDVGRMNNPTKIHIYPYIENNDGSSYLDLNQFGRI